MQKNKIKWIVLFLFVAVVIWQYNTLLCLIIPAFNAVTNRNFTDSGLNKSFFWVFDPPEKVEGGTLYSGAHYWNGYFANIVKFDDSTVALEYYDKFLKTGKAASKKLDHLFYEEVDSHTTYFALGSNTGEAFYFQILSRRDNYFLKLEQGTEQFEYQKYSIISDLLEDFFEE